ncbi:hypothetical protein JCM2421_21230 [Staphylococcus auricularis]|nr:hypothetical protein JCM2421_21230 [Staphylococcus auricularis]
MVITLKFTEFKKSTPKYRTYVRVMIDYIYRRTGDSGNYNNEVMPIYKDKKEGRMA